LTAEKKILFIENIYFAAPWTLLPGAAALLAPPWIRPSRFGFLRKRVQLTKIVWTTMCKTT